MSSTWTNITIVSAKIIGSALLCVLLLAAGSCCGSGRERSSREVEGPGERGAASSPGDGGTEALTECLGRASRFGVDYAFPLMPRYREQRWPRELAKLGAGWVNFAEVSWKRIEKRPPTGGAHRYQWDELDQAVSLWQARGFHIVMSLRLGSGWFKGPISHQPAVHRLLVDLYVHHSDRLPAAEHRAAYGAWIEALVERYDGDGHLDMPGLASPILHYQVGNEYANPMFWTGTAEDYSTLLTETRVAAKRATPEVQIISNGIRWNDLFHDDPTGLAFEPRFHDFLARLPSDEWRSEWIRGRRITEKTVALAESYEILDAGGNGPYPSASKGYMAWVRRELAKTGATPEIWDMEARSEPRLVEDPNFTFHPGQQIPEGDRIVRILRNRTHREHRRMQAWYRAEQARTLTKVFVTRFASGFEKVFMGMPDDWDRGPEQFAGPNPFVGLMDRSANPWPAFHAFSLLVSKLDGFRTAEQVAGPAGVDVYRFAFEEGRPVWVAWLKQTTPLGPVDAHPVKLVSFTEISSPAIVRPIPTSNDEPRPIQFSAGEAVEFDLSTTPVIISEN